jgi:hypothetical protein
VLNNVCIVKELSARLCYLLGGILKIQQEVS